MTSETKTWPANLEPTGLTATFPERPGVSETFEYVLDDWEGITYTWDVNMLQARANGREITLQELGPLVNVILAEPGRIDPRRVMTDPDINPNLPILSLPLPFPGAPDGVSEFHVVVDGWHRIARAWAEGRFQIGMVLLTPDDERAARISPSQEELIRIVTPQVARRNAEAERRSEKPAPMLVPTLDGYQLLPPTTGGICDFCSDRPVVWCYPAESFVLESYRWRSIGAWGACERCAARIEDGAYESLAARCIERLVQTHPGPWGHQERQGAEQFIRTQHSLFAINRAGPRHPDHDGQHVGPHVGPHEYPGDGGG